MRLRAIGLPMIPRPMKPIFSAMASSPSLVEFQVLDGGILVTQLFGQPHEALLRSPRSRVVLEAHVTAVAELFELRENIGVVDLTGPRLSTPGRVGYLDVSYEPDVLAEVRDEV